MIDIQSNAFIWSNTLKTILSFDVNMNTPKYTIQQRTSTDEVCEWISNFILQLTEHVITYPCRQLS